MGWTEEDERELQQLEAEFSNQPSSGLTPNEELELESLEMELGGRGPGGMGGNPGAGDSVPWSRVAADTPQTVMDSWISTVSNGLSAANDAAQQPNDPFYEPEQGILPSILSTPRKLISRGIKTAIDYSIPDDMGFREAARGAGEATAERQQNYTDNQRFWGTAASTVGEFAPLVFTGPLGMTAYGTSKFAGNKYNEYKDRGLSQDEATRFTALQALPQAILERLGFGKIFKTSTGIVPRVLTTTVTEGGTEFVQEVAEDIGDAILTDDEFDWRETTEKGWESAKIGAVAGASNTIIYEGISNVQKKINKSNDTNQSFPDSPEDNIKSIREEKAALQPISGPLESELEYDQTLSPEEQLVAPPKDPSKVKQFIDKNFTSRRGLPEEVFDIKDRSEGFQSAAKQELENIAADYKTAIKKAKKETGKDYQELDTQVNSVLKKEAPLDTLPADLQLATQNMRNQLDQLTTRIVEDEVLSGEASETLLNNIGVYLNRSYERFENYDNWKKNISDSQIANFQALLSKQNPKQEGESEAEYTNRITGIYETYLYDNGGLLDSLSKDNVTKKNLNVLKKKEEVPEALREFWGERTSALENYSTSVVKMTNLIASHKFLKDTATQLEGSLIFNEPQPGFAAQISSESNKTMDPLNGKFTSPEFKQAFEDLMKPEHQAKWLSGLYKANAVFKWNKTVANPITHVRNFTANPLFLVKNGNLFNGLRNSGDAFKTMGVDLLPESVLNLAKSKVGFKKQEWRDYHLKLTKLGLTDNSVNAKELHGIFKDAFGDSKNPIDMSTNLSKRAIKATTKAATKLYQAEDTFWKVLNWKAEVDKYKRAYPDKSIDEIEYLAAKITRDTMPDYSRVPEAVQQLRKIPVVAPFVAFSSEVMRTNYNTVALIKQEMKNPETRGIASRRIAGMIAAHAAPVALAEGFKMLNDISEEDDEALRTLAADWDKNSNLLYTGRDKKGNINYLNLSYSDPFAMFKNAYIAMATSPEDVSETEAFINGMKEIAEPFISEEVLSKSLIDVSRNQTSDGRKIYLETDSAYDKNIKRATHVWKAFEPGIITTGKRMKKAVKGEISRGGKVYSLPNEITALTTGLRPQKLDPVDVVSYRSSDFMRNNSDSTRIFNSVATSRGTVSSMEIVEAIRASTTAKTKVHEEYRKELLAAARLGASSEDIQKTAKAMRVSGKKLAEVLGQSYKPFRISDQSWAKIKSIPGREQQVIEALTIIANQNNP